MLIFSKSTLSKNSFRNTIRVSNSLNPDQARQNVRPDLDPNCLQRLSADNTRRYYLFLVYCRELAPGTVSLTGDRAQGDDSKHDSHCKEIILQSSYNNKIFY